MHPLIFFLISLFSVLPARAEPLRMFDGYVANTRASVVGANFWFIAAGFASTALLVKSGADARVYSHFRGNNSDAPLPGAVLGSGVGALWAGAWLYFAAPSDDHETAGAAYTIAQASFITLGHVALLKLTTGRAHPTNTWDLVPQQQSEQWQFGFLRNGLTAYGWPSGHVAHTVAVTSALAHYYPSKTWLKWLSVGLSSYMLYTVVAHDAGQMHWFSDGVAGAFIGYAVGVSVGTNMRARVDGLAEPASSSWHPVLLPNYAGIIWNF